MNSTDYGVMIFTRAAVESASTDMPERVDLSVVLANLAESGNLAGVETEAAYWEIGTPETLNLVRRHFARNQ